MLQGMHIPSLNKEHGESERNNNLLLKISAQALIEHDLRLHSRPSAKEMAAMLKGA